jgi:hypothetical protein
MNEIEYERLDYPGGEISYRKSMYKLRAGGDSIQKVHMTGFCFQFPLTINISKPKITIVTQEEYNSSYEKRVIWKSDAYQ